MFHSAHTRIIRLAVGCLFAPVLTAAVLTSVSRAVAQQGDVFSGSTSIPYCVIDSITPLNTIDRNGNALCDVKIRCPKPAPPYGFGGNPHSLTVPCACTSMLSIGAPVVLVGAGEQAKLITDPTLASALTSGAIQVQQGSGSDLFLNDLAVLAKTPTGQSLLSGITVGHQNRGSQVMIQTGSNGSLHTNPAPGGTSSQVSWVKATSPLVTHADVNPTRNLYPGVPTRTAQGWDFNAWEAQAFDPSNPLIAAMGGFLGTGTSAMITFDPFYSDFQQYPDLRALGLGHELTHALHFLTGNAQSWPGWNSQTGAYDNNFPWREEFYTIADPSAAITENNLRHDLNALYGWNLPDRHGELETDFIRGVKAGVAAPDGYGC